MKTHIKLNASALKISSCSRRLYWTVVEGWREKVFNNDIEFGTAFHLFAARVEEKPNTPEGYLNGIIEAQNYFENTPMIVKPMKRYLTTQHLGSVCIDWYNIFRKADDAKILRTANDEPFIEIPFEIPFYSSADVDISICGTIDKVVKFPSGCIAIGDYKTTSYWDQTEYFRSYLLSVQVRLYLWALLKMCKIAPEDSFFAKIQRPESIGAFIDGIFLNGEKKTEFKRSSILFLSRDDMQEFETMLENSCHELAMLVRKGQELEEFIPSPDGIMSDSCTTKYGNCKFFGCCAAPNTKLAKMILKQAFNQTVYDPLNLH